MKLAAIVLVCGAALGLLLWLQLRSRARAPELSQDILRRRLPQWTAPVTARQAAELVLAEARSRDAGARLLEVASGEDIDAQGRSSRWWFLFHLPNGRKLASYELAPARDWNGDLPIPYELEERLRPAGAGTRPALPIPFRDSSEAARALAAQGLDFAAASTSMALSARATGTSEPQWEIQAVGRTYRTPFGTVSNR
ncbi:MAG TPA: hypothetical protein VNO22_08175 [Planctomycetota bacterium]|nr:hypothetical protein [Planctomycetota bacterium]